VIIHSLAAKNFLKYAELELSDLPHQGLIGISGLNESGKSSIGETICFALYGRTFTLGGEDVLKVIRWGETQCSVRLRFGVNSGAEYEIARMLDDEGNHSARLCRADQPDEPLARGVEAVEHALFRLLGYEFEEFIESFYLAQREITTPHPHSHALKVMAGVAPLEYLAEQLDQEIGELDNDLERLAEDQERITQDLERLGIQEERLGSLEADLAHAQVKTLGLNEQAQELESAAEAYRDNLTRRDAASSHRSTAALLRSVMLLLAVIGGGAWLVLAQFSGELPPGLIEALTSLLPTWEDKLPWLLYAAAGFGVLFLLLWIRHSSLNADVQEFDQQAQLLADQLTGAREQFPYDPASSVAEGEIDRPAPEELDALQQRVGLGTADAAAVDELVRREVAWLQRAAEQQQADQASVEAAIREEQEGLRQAQLLKQELEGCGEQVEKRQHRIEVRELAGELLEGATHRISQRFNRNLRDLAGRTLPLFTEGRYQHLQIDDDLSVRVFSSQKRDFIELDEISSGTQRQIMLAVRLALSQELVERTVHGPQFVILDEPFAFFDQERALSSLAVLPELGDQLAQVWIIAQHFPDDAVFASHIRCSRDSDHMVYRGLVEAPPETLEVGFQASEDEGT